MCSRSNLFKQRNCSIIKLETNLSSWVIIQSRRGLVNPLSWGDCRLHLNWPRLCRSTLRVSDKVWLIFSCTNYFHFIPTEHDLAGRLDLLLRTIFLQQQQLLFGSLVVGFIRSSLQNDAVPTSRMQLLKMPLPYQCSWKQVTQLTQVTKQTSKCNNYHAMDRTSNTNGLWDIAHKNFKSLICRFSFVKPLIWSL